MRSDDHHPIPGASDARPAVAPTVADARSRPTRETTLRVGDRLPDVELIDHGGRTWRASDHHGRPLVLVLHRHLA